MSRVRRYLLTILSLEGLERSLLYALMSLKNGFEGDSRKEICPNSIPLENFQEQKTTHKSATQTQCTKTLLKSGSNKRTLEFYL